MLLFQLFHEVHIHLPSFYPKEDVELQNQSIPYIIFGNINFISKNWEILTFHFRILFFVISRDFFFKVHLLWTKDINTTINLTEKLTHNSVKNLKGFKEIFQRESYTYYLYKDKNCDESKRNISINFSKVQLFSFSFSLGDFLFFFVSLSRSSTSGFWLLFRNFFFKFFIRVVFFSLNTLSKLFEECGLILDLQIIRVNLILNMF